MPHKKKHPLAVRVGANIARLRDLKGWNQAALGRRLGVGQKSVSEIETGAKSLPKADSHRLVGWLSHCAERTRGALLNVREMCILPGLAFRGLPS